MQNLKMVLVYNESGQIKKESVWVTKVGNYYQVDNIPFFAPNIALGDIVEVEQDDDELYFQQLISASGHSTIQLIFFKEEAKGVVLLTLENMECSWEGSHLKNYIAVDVPSEQNYSSVKPYLLEQRANGVLDFKEACLGFS